MVEIPLKSSASYLKVPVLYSGYLKRVEQTNAVF